jgi:hypothetical protein
MPRAASQWFQTKALTENEFSPRWYPSVRTSAELTDPREKAWEYSSEASSYKVIYRTPSLPNWVRPTISGFTEIQRLPENWDSYHGRVVSRDLIKQSLFVLSHVMKPDFPAPSVVPLGDGGLQIEWHRKQQDLEIVFAADDAPQFYYRNRTSGNEQEGSVYNFTTLTQLLGELA